MDAIVEQYDIRRALKIDQTNLIAKSGTIYSYFDTFTCYESFMLTGNFTFLEKGSFGLCFDYNGRTEKYKMISIKPAENKIQLSFNEGNTLIAETEINLVEGKEYSFTYIQEGSVGVFYIDDMAALTVRIYGASGKAIKLFAENNTVKFSSLRQYTKK